MFFPCKIRVKFVEIPEKFRISRIFISYAREEKLVSLKTHGKMTDLASSISAQTTNGTDTLKKISDLLKEKFEKIGAAKACKRKDHKCRRCEKIIDATAVTNQSLMGHLKECSKYTPEERKSKVAIFAANVSADFTRTSEQMMV